jgi:hypothetical protein
MKQSPKWAQTLQSHVWLFNVGRGLSIFIRTALNQGILYDFGSGKDFSPTKFIKEKLLPHLDAYKNCKVAQTIISHPHADHIAEIDCLSERDGQKSPFNSSLHTCPHDKTDGSAEPEALNWGRINNPKESEESVNLYKNLYASRTLPLQTICYKSTRMVPNLEYGLFYVRPPIVGEIHPKNDQDYGNGMSLILFYRHGNHTVLIPGDITPDCLDHILEEGKGLEKRYTIFDRQKNEDHHKWHLRTDDQPSLKSLLKTYGLSILVAPHHGLESCFSEKLYEAIKGNKPDLVVISEKRHNAENDGSVDDRYQNANGASGLNVNIEGTGKRKFSVSTTNGHHILISLEGTGGCPKVYLEKDPDKLVQRIGG